MNITNANIQQSFQSKIKFINSKEFNKLKMKDAFYCANPKNPLMASMKNSNSMYTWDIRTCSAGGVVGKDSAVGFHIYDDKVNIEKVNNDFAGCVKSLIKEPVSALLLGAKGLEGRCGTSVQLFDAVCGKIKEMVRPSVFRIHSNPFAQSDLAYDHLSDTWFINTNDILQYSRNRKSCNIESVADLRVCLIR